MKFKFAHNNFNVLDLEKSLRFYEEALGFKATNSFNGPGFVITYLSDGGNTPISLN